MQLQHSDDSPALHLCGFMVLVFKCFSFLDTPFGYPACSCPLLLTPFLSLPYLFLSPVPYFSFLSSFCPPSLPLLSVPTAINRLTLILSYIVYWRTSTTFLSVRTWAVGRCGGRLLFCCPVLGKGEALQFMSRSHPELTLGLAFPPSGARSSWVLLDFASSE